MAWNKYYLVITGQEGVTATEVLNKLGLSGYQPGGEVTFHQTNKSDDLFIGSYRDMLVIANPDLTYSFFGDEASDMERKVVTASLPRKSLSLPRIAPSENSDTR